MSLDARILTILEKANRRKVTINCKTPKSAAALQRRLHRAMVTLENTIIQVRLLGHTTLIVEKKPLK